MRSSIIVSSVKVVLICTTQHNIQLSIIWCRSIVTRRQSRRYITCISCLMLNKALEIVTRINVSLILVGISYKMNLRSSNISVEVTFQVLC